MCLQCESTKYRFLFHNRIFVKCLIGCIYTIITYEKITLFIAVLMFSGIIEVSISKKKTLLQSKSK